MANLRVSCRLCLEWGCMYVHVLVYHCDFPLACIALFALIDRCFLPSNIVQQQVFRVLLTVNYSGCLQELQSSQFALNDGRGRHPSSVIMITNGWLQRCMMGAMIKSLQSSDGDTETYILYSCTCYIFTHKLKQFLTINCNCFRSLDMTGSQDYVVRSNSCCRDDPCTICQSEDSRRVVCTQVQARRKQN